MRFCLLIGLLWPATALAVDVDDPTPAFSLRSIHPADATKHAISLPDHRRRVVCVNFWSACRAPGLDAMPSHAAPRRRDPAQALEIIAINVDPRPAVGLRALGEIDSRYPTASDPAADSAIIYGVEKLPAAFVIDAEGILRLIQRGSGPKDMEQTKATISALIETSFDAERIGVDI